jgi:hypothetical protein
MSTNDEQHKPSVLADLPRSRPQLRSDRRASAKPRVAAPAKPGATTKAAGTVATAAKPKPRAKATPRATKPKLEPVAPAPPPRDEQPFVATALQAAGELAHLGLAVGARAVRNAIDRLPKP